MRYLTYLFPLVLLFVTACGGGSDDQNQAQNTDTQTTANQSSEVRTINIIGVDQMKYVVKDENQQGITTGTEVGSDGMLELETISAEPGEQIRIQLTTQSQMPATAMAHNFILLALSADVDAFNSAAIKAKDNGYIPSGLTDQIIAHTDLAGGGETVEVTFTVPEETGDYPFLCSFPGHYAAGMEGTLNVE
ncbi:MAG: plastocyanin/azurin family copper-binding protein [Balneolaceae bacterium]|nr:plastocyanin/azurin family copper-binding protein [Balneolaceae bacterium]